MSADDLEEERAHELIWKKLFDEIEALLKDFVHRGLIGLDNYWLVDEDWGWDVLQIELPLTAVWPALVGRLQDILVQYPDWRITVRVADRPEGWPGMGIIVSRDRVVDDLKREFLPAGLRDMTF